MGFEKKVHRDGDVVFDVPHWRRQWEDLSEKTRSLELSVARDDAQLVGSQEVGLKHNKSGAIVRLKDDGSIELFAESSGIRITQSGIQMFGQKIQIMGGEMDVLTTPHGFQENGAVVTEGYAAFPRKKGKSERLLDLCKETGMTVMRKEDLL